MNIRLKKDFLRRWAQRFIISKNFLNIIIRHANSNYIIYIYMISKRVKAWKYHDRTYVESWGLSSSAVGNLKLFNHLWKKFDAT